MGELWGWAGRCWSCTVGVLQGVDVQVGPTPAVQGFEGRCFAAGTRTSRLCLCSGDTGRSSPFGRSALPSCPEGCFGWCLIKSDFQAGPVLASMFMWPGLLNSGVCPSSTSHQPL